MKSAMPTALALAAMLAAPTTAAAQEDEPTCLGQPATNPCH